MSQATKMVRYWDMSITEFVKSECITMEYQPYEQRSHCSHACIITKTETVLSGLSCRLWFLDARILVQMTWYLERAPA